MTRVYDLKPDPKLDLVFERIVDVPREPLWRAWTEPELLKKWFTPVPWQTIDCEIDLRPGGIFRTVMRSPEGQDMPPNIGCYLEVVENERLVWTSTMGAGYRPSHPTSCGPFHFTAVLSLAPHGNGTKYSALVTHGTEAERKTHAGKGFHDGWGTALDQLVAHAKTM
jgi:uncharacterized protein YndB with AHSA1/START domain